MKQQQTACVCAPCGARTGGCLARLAGAICPGLRWLEMASAHHRRELLQILAPVAGSRQL